MTPPPNPFPFTVKQCASCGEEHAEALWNRFNYAAPLQYGLRYWSLCPTTGQPTFLMNATDPPGSEYGIWSVTHGVWLIDPSGVIFHTTSRDMAIAQLVMVRSGPIIATWEVRRFGDTPSAESTRILGPEGEIPS